MNFCPPDTFVYKNLIYWPASVYSKLFKVFFLSVFSCGSQDTVLTYSIEPIKLHIPLFVIEN